jgi:rhodanese-related sulfurtransferase
MKRLTLLLFTTLALAAQATTAVALDVKLTPEKDSLEVQHQGKSVKIERIQDEANVVDSSWGKTSRKCPPFCPQPVNVAPGVKVAGELEVFEFMENHVNKGTGLLIDARVESWHNKGTIPGSINIPFTEFERKTGPELDRVMKLLGAKPRSNVGMLEVTWDKTLRTIGMDPKRQGFWDFNEVQEVMLWCNGPWCGQSPHAIKGLLSLGFPAEKIHYYRGGMQMWLIMGLPVIKSE